ncbi:MAG: hypothetical protein PHG27_04020 [Massilibacteroides sp.]|nr:hypothetical protein [Massilibacteroides sp.]MDD4114750.1 hypothetical protein [Massilibacteroides sp.]MDD4659898.1 hypothetical protein [Massilibacteroides sp.]
MKKLLLFLTFLIAYLGNTHSQQHILRIQGHERPDIQVTNQQKQTSKTLS